MSPQVMYIIGNISGLGFYFLALSFGIVAGVQ